jgi:hypothetical protein
MSFSVKSLINELAEIETETKMKISNDKLLDLKTSVEIALEIYEALKEYDTEIRESDRRKSKQLIDERSIYEASLKQEIEIVDRVIREFCNLDFVAKNSMAYASYLRIIQNKIETECIRRKLC